jgi:hypothetical protein
MVTIYIVLEELIWENIAEPIYTFIHGLSILHKAEEFINELNRHVLLVLFLALFIQVELLGIFALKMIGTGNVIAGTALYAGKIPGEPSTSSKSLVSHQCPLRASRPRLSTNAMPILNARL